MIKRILKWLGLGDLLCDLGIHNWVVIETQDGLRWKCTRCGKVER